VAAEEPDRASGNQGRLDRPAEVDVRREPDGPVADAERGLPDRGDDFTGSAPDLGA
jgi:hypothetical protein